jgi:hypothetical protein
MTTYTEYTKHLKNSDFPVLGMLAWYSVPETAEITHAEFVKLVETSDAPVKTPEVPKAADVFRRACNAAKSLKQPTGIPDVFANYTMRDAGYDDGFVFRRMVEEKVDGKNHSLGYRVLGLVSFAKKGVRASFSRDIPEDDPAIGYWDDMCKDINDFIDARMLFLTAIAVRETARRSLETTLRGTRVRPGGGVYFVAVEKAEKLEALDYVINSVDNASFHILPLIDDEKQREMLKVSFEDESVEETDRLVGEIATLLKSDKNIPAKTFTNIQQRYAEQKGRMTEYSALLNDALNRSSTSLEVANAQIRKLLDKTV